MAARRGGAGVGPGRAGRHRRRRCWPAAGERGALAGRPSSAAAPRSMMNSFPDPVAWASGRAHGPRCVCIGRRDQHLGEGVVPHDGRCDRAQRPADRPAHPGGRRALDRAARHRTGEVVGGDTARKGVWALIVSAWGTGSVADLRFVTRHVIGQEPAPCSRSSRSTVPSPGWSVRAGASQPGPRQIHAGGVEQIGAGNQDEPQQGLEDVGVYTTWRTGQQRTHVHP